MDIRFFNFSELIKIARDRKIIAELLVVKKLPVDLKGKNSKKQIMKKGNANKLILSVWFE